MKKYLRFFIVVMAIFLLISYDRDNPSITLASSESTTKAVKAEHITLRWLGGPWNPYGGENTYPERLLEQQFNISIEPIFLSADDYRYRLPVMLSSGNIPDVIYLLDNNDIQVFASCLASVPYSIIRRYAPQYYNYLNEQDPESWLLSFANETNYGVPNISPESVKIDTVGVWRQDWLKKLGIMKIPETLDEFEQAFYKIAHEDPDNNGKSDTYGMSGDMTEGSKCFPEIFGAFGVLPFSWMRVNGKIVYGGELPGTKEALQLLSAWYAKGYIHPDFITDNADASIHEKFTTGQIGYMDSGGSAYATDESRLDTLISMVQWRDPDGEIAIASLPKGPRGKIGTKGTSRSKNIIAFGHQVEKEPDKMKRILTIIERLHTDDKLNQLLHIGEQNTHWQFVNEAEGWKGGIQFNMPFSNPYRAVSECLNKNMSEPTFFALIPISNPSYQHYVTDIEEAFNKKYGATAHAMVDVFSDFTIEPTLEKRYQMLVNEQLNTFSLIIRGEKPIDYYDQFLVDWHDQGGDDLIQKVKEFDWKRNLILQRTRE